MATVKLALPSLFGVLCGLSRPVRQVMEYPRLWPVLLVYRQDSPYRIIKLDYKPLLQRLAQRRARQKDTICSFIWTDLATIGSLNVVNIQWILGHVGLEGNTEADLEAKRGTSLPQSSAPMDFISVGAAIKWHQQSVADDRYHGDSHARITGARRQCQPVPALATRLDQEPVHHGGPAAHWSFSVAGRISTPYQMPGLCHLSTLKRR